MDSSAVDPTTWSAAFQVTGGWLFAVLVVELVGYFILSDRLMTRGQLKRVRESLDAELERARADRDLWRTIADKADERADLDRETVRRLLPAAEVAVRSTQLIQQLPSTHEGRDPV